MELAVGIWFLRSAARIWLSFFPDINHDTIASVQFSTPIILDAIGIAILGFLLLGLMVMDWQTHLLPDAFTLTGIAIALFLVCTQAIFLSPHEGDVVLNTTHQLRMSSPGSMGIHGNIFLTGTEALVFGRLAAVIGVAFILITVRWGYYYVRGRHLDVENEDLKKGLGLGDVKLLAMIAAFLGFWPAILALFIGVLTATAYALLLLVRGRANALTKLPLGSFLSAGGLIAALFGSRLIDMYAALLR